MPTGYRMVNLILLFPCVIVTTKYVTLVAPVLQWTMEFIEHAYEGLALYLFARLLIMFLGMYKSGLDVLAKCRPTKYFAVLPFFCWAKPFMTARNMTPTHFRFTLSLITQYAILAPLLAFVKLFRALEVSLYGRHIFPHAVRVFTKLNSFSLWLLFLGGTHE